jgi:hypothetical protein
VKRISSLIIVTLAACGGSNNATVALGARAGTAASTTASTGASALNQQGRLLTLDNGIVITRLRMVIDEVKLEGAAATAADAGVADAGEDQGDEVEFKTAPVLLDLSGSSLDNGTTQQVTIADVKAGTYREIKFKIHKPSSADAGVSADSGLSEMAAKNASVIVDGTIDGATFSFVSSVDAQQELEGTFNLGDGNHTLTLNLDATTWFGSTVSARLDPRVPGNVSAINNNIQRSLKAFQDDDHDGHEDH